ncbi:hypothetical protein SAMN02910418_01390 [Bowdeniella nasicola]|uniref:Uncharacterized protein n=1 Tax=Bowdeniella nasicola TaxID=208480 RepID=A0A1H4ACB6_9ACTO|nr:hypothetical protein [Bowdeniella nasicola]SEA33154.1 hypothetical protein SAMN02910418_01390 [Bowdeniella nasicola]
MNRRIRYGAPTREDGSGRLLLTLAFLATGLLIADAAIAAGDTIDLDELQNHPAVVTAMLTALVIALLAIPIGLGYARLQRRFSQRARLIAGVTIIVIWIVGLSVASSIIDTTIGLRLGLLERLGLLIVAATLSFIELDRILTWAGRRALREIAAAIPAVARILPLLLLTVLLVFFTNELWQLAAAMSKGQMWALGTFLVIMIVVIIVPAIIDMLDDEDTEDDHGPILSDTPFCDVSPSRSRFSVGEWINLVAVSAAVQLVQVALFIVATFAIFALFGWIALTPKLIQTWTGAKPEALHWLGVNLPMDASMFRVCLILALFFGISFAASTLSDSLYRSLFLGRIAEEMRRNIAARHRYRSTLRSCGKLPHRWHDLMT